MEERDKVMTEADIKAQEIVEQFYKNHLIAVANSKGRLQPPYTSWLIQDKVIKSQSKRFALICVDEIIKSNHLNVYTIEQAHEVDQFYTAVKSAIEAM